MNSALKHTLELFNLTRIDRDLYSWTGKSVGLKNLWWSDYGSMFNSWYQTVEKQDGFTHFIHTF